MAIAIKHLKSFLFLPLFVCLYGCPDENDCNDIMTGGIAEVPGLIMIEPLQEIYQLGDEIIFKCSVPSNNIYFGEDTNLFQATQNHHALLVVGEMMDYVRLIDSGNELQFLKGMQGEYPNWVKLTYNSFTDNYELEILIKLNKLGEYGIISSNNIVFEGTKNCNRFRLDTSILGAVDGKIHFVVVE